MKLLGFLSFIFLFALSNCKKRDNTPLELNNLSENKADYDNYLIQRSNGFHRLNGITIKDSSYGIIAVHGYYPSEWRKKGYEWIEPLSILSEKKIPMWFFKYDYTNCMDKSTNYLHEQLEPFLDEHNYLDSLWIIGHSMGGIIAALLAEQWDLRTPITVHSIAASLGGNNKKIPECDKFKKTQYIINENVRFTQWKTRKEEDGIFSIMDFDPQIVTLNRGKSILLPKKWNDIRIGHNFSITWVCKNI